MMYIHYDRWFNAKEEVEAAAPSSSAVLGAPFKFYKEKEEALNDLREVSQLGCLSLFLLIHFINHRWSIVSVGP